MTVVFQKKKKKFSDLWDYTDNSKKWLIYPYTFLCIIIILTYRKIYFHLYTISFVHNILVYYHSLTLTTLIKSVRQNNYNRNSTVKQFMNKFILF